MSINKEIYIPINVEKFKSEHTHYELENLLGVCFPSFHKHHPKNELLKKHLRLLGNPNEPSAFDSQSKLRKIIICCTNGWMEVASSKWLKHQRIPSRLRSFSGYRQQRSQTNRPWKVWHFAYLLDRVTWRRLAGLQFGSFPESRLAEWRWAVWPTDYQQGRHQHRRSGHVDDWRRNASESVLVLQFRQPFGIWRVLWNSDSLYCCEEKVSNHDGLEREVRSLGDAEFQRDDASNHQEPNLPQEYLLLRCLLEWQRGFRTGDPIKTTITGWQNWFAGHLFSKAKCLWAF